MASQFGDAQSTAVSRENQDEAEAGDNAGHDVERSSLNPVCVADEAGCQPRHNYRGCRQLTTTRVSTSAEAGAASSAPNAVGTPGLFAAASRNIGKAFGLPFVASRPNSEVGYLKDGSVSILECPYRNSQR